MLLGISILILILFQIKILIIDSKKVVEPTSRLGGSKTIGTREVQEDCYYIQETKQGSFLALVDGMGESYGGRIAARAPISVCEDMFVTYNLLDNPRYFFRKIFMNANKEILKNMDNGAKGFASLATGLIANNKFYYSVVGNVKVFIYRNKDLIEV